MKLKEIAHITVCLGLLVSGWSAQAGTTNQTAKTEKTDFAAYLGAAWGPDGETIYCIKLILNPKTGRQYWLCKMKWDGSEKQDICELWPGQSAFVDTQSGPVWMEVNAATSNIAFSVEYGNEASVGLWAVGLDGKRQHRPFPLVWNEKERWAPLHPSWSPDGTKIVYEEDDRTTPESTITRLVLYDLHKKERKQLTDGPRDQHPVWSPKGDWIAYTHYLRYDNAYAIHRIWLIRPDGSEQKPVVDEKGKPVNGWWPSWNLAGTMVSVVDDGLALASLSPAKVEWIDPLPILGECIPWTFMGHQWGKHGWLLTFGAIRFIDFKARHGRLLAGSGEGRWGAVPAELQGKTRTGRFRK